jgi:hypothetical protein
LRSDQTGDATRKNVLHDGGRSPAARGIAIQDGMRDTGKDLGKSVGDSLGPRADRLQNSPAAIGATRRPRPLFSTVVAYEGTPAVVDGARNAAAAAPELVAAVPAEQKRCEPAAWLEQDRLFSAIEHLPEAFHQRP